MIGAALIPGMVAGERASSDEPAVDRDVRARAVASGSADDDHPDPVDPVGESAERPGPVVGPRGTREVAPTDRRAVDPDPRLPERGTGDRAEGDRGPAE